MARKLKPIQDTPRETSQNVIGDSYVLPKSTPVNPNDNRALQTNTKLSNWKDLSVGFEDIDNAIIYYCNEVIKPSVFQNGVYVPVPLVYGNPERWKSIQEDGYYRDKEGKFMAPILVFKRVNIEKNRSLGNKLDGNEVHLYQTFEAKYNKRNNYDKFSTLTNRIPERQIYMTMVPDYVNITYEMVVFTEYVEQMNKIIESIEFASDSYWGDASKYQFRARIDNFSNITEVSVGENRIVKTTFNLILNGYIIPDSINHKMATQQIMYEPTQVIIGIETTL